ncbi:MAG: hypothetical protein ACC653_05035 [Gammaproteobacteria bacterium]
MKNLLLSCLLTLPMISFAATDPKLDAACDAAREAKLAPERQTLIKKCVASGKNKSQCDSYYKSYGDAAGNSRNYTARKYDNLPECVAAQKARSDHRAGSNKVNTSRDSDPKRTNYR